MFRFYIRKEDLLTNDAYKCKLFTTSDSDDDIVIFLQTSSLNSASHNDMLENKKYGSVQIVYHGKTLFEGNGGVYISNDNFENSPLHLIWLFPDQLHYVKNLIEIDEINQNISNNSQNKSMSVLYKQRAIVRTELARYHIIHEG